MDYEHVPGLTGGALAEVCLLPYGKSSPNLVHDEKNYRPPESGKQLMPVISVRSFGIVEKMPPRGRAENARQEPRLAELPNNLLLFNAQRAKGSSDSQASTRIRSILRNGSAAPHNN